MYIENTNIQKIYEYQYTNNFTTIVFLLDHLEFQFALLYMYWHLWHKWNGTSKLKIKTQKKKKYSTNKEKLNQFELKKF